MPANDIGRTTSTTTWRYADGTRPYVSTTQSRLAYAEEIRSGVKRRRPVGWKYPTAYSLQSTFIAEPVGTWQFLYPPGSYYTSITRTGVVIQFSPVYYGPTTVPSHVTSGALTDAMLDAKEMKVDLATSLAEGRQTAQLITDTASFLANAYTSLRSGDWKGFRRLTGWSDKPGRTARELGKTAASAWLSYRYGWTPLLSSVYGAAEALALTARTIPPVTARGKREEDVNNSQYVGSGTDYGRFYSTKGKVGSTARLDFLPDGGCLQQLRSLGLTNPLLVAWELVPYSFVVDWFIPIGNALSCLDWATGLTWVSGSQSGLIRAQTDVVPGVLSNGAWADVHGLQKRVYLNRVPFTDKPNVPLPSFSLPFPSAYKVADSMALLFNAFSSPSFK